MKIVRDFKVAGYTWLNESNFLIEFQSADDLPPIHPGNFAEIQVPGNPNVFLRRPFSIYDADLTYNTLTFYVKVIGEGTATLGRLRQGEMVNIIFPLGNKFGTDTTGPVLIVGGGSGIAPFLLLGKELKAKSIPATFLIGGRTSGDVHLTDVFSSYGDIMVTTEDGSREIKGLVTHHPVFRDKDFPYTKIYACGPDPMMKAIAHLAKQRGVECEVSLENTMACGFGACLCCVVETTTGNRCVCTDGPVFNIKELAW